MISRASLRGTRTGGWTTSRLGLAQRLSPPSCYCVVQMGVTLQRDGDENRFEPSLDQDEVRWFSTQLSGDVRQNGYVDLDEFYQDLDVNVSDVVAVNLFGLGDMYAWFELDVADVWDLDTLQEVAGVVFRHALDVPVRELFTREEVEDRTVDVLSGPRDAAMAHNQSDVLQRTLYETETVQLNQVRQDFVFGSSHPQTSLIRVAYNTRRRISNYIRSVLPDTATGDDESPTRSLSEAVERMYRENFVPEVAVARGADDIRSEYVYSVENDDRTSDRSMMGVDIYDATSRAILQKAGIVGSPSYCHEIQSGEMSVEKVDGLSRTDRGLVVDGVSVLDTQWFKWDVEWTVLCPDAMCGFDTTAPPMESTDDAESSGHTDE